MLKVREKMLSGRVLTTFMAGVLVFFSGCENGGDNSPISISPPVAALQTGQSIDFTASGGSDYQWGLKYEDTGRLSTRSGPTVRFATERGHV